MRTRRQAALAALKTPKLYDKDDFLIIHDPTAKDNFSLCLVKEPVHEGQEKLSVTYLVRDVNHAFNYFMPIGDQQILATRVLFKTDQVQVAEQKRESPRRGSVAQTLVYLRRGKYADIQAKVAEILAQRKREADPEPEPEEEPEEEEEDEEKNSVEMRKLRKAELVERLGVSGPGSKRRGPSRGRSVSRGTSKGRTSVKSDEDYEDPTKGRSKAPVPKPKTNTAAPAPGARAGSVDVIVTVARAQRLKAGSAQPAPARAPRAPSVPRARKPPKPEKPFKRGVYNHGVVFNGFCEQYESKKTEPNTECCPDCTAKEFVRAAKTDNITLLRNMVRRSTEATSTCVPQGPRSPNYAFAVALRRGQYDQLDVILELEKSMKFSTAPRRIQFNLVNTGENNKYAYGVKTRQVEMARAGREGTNAFLYDASIDYQSFSVQPIIDQICRHLRSYDLWCRLESLYPTFVNMMNYNFYQIIENGNLELASWVAKRFVDSNGFGFNKFHHLALAANDPAELADMSKVNCRKKASGNRQVTPFHLACLNPNPQILLTFIEKSDEIHITDEYQRKPIHYAALNPTVNAIRVLLDRGIDCRDYDRYKWTPLMFAAQANRAGNIQMMCDHLPYPVNMKNRESNAALHIACRNGNLEAIRMLVTKGADINLPGGQRMTPLMLACEADCFEAVQLLVEMGAKITPSDKFRKTALIHATISGNPKTVSYLLTKGAEFNKADSSGNTPLHYACAYGHYEMIDRLHLAGANINAVNAWNLQPILVAMMKNHYRCVRILVGYPEIDVNCQDKDGNSLVMSCFFQNTSKSLEFCRHLIRDKRADVNLTDQSGNTVFHKLAMVKAAKPSPENGYRVAKEIQIAENRRYEEFFRLFCEANVAKNQRNLKGFTALEIAFEEENWKFVEMAVGEPGVDFVSPNEHGKVVLSQMAGIFLYKNGLALAQRVVDLFPRLRDLEQSFDSHGLNFYHSVLTNFVTRCRVNPFASYYSAKMGYYTECLKRLTDPQETDIQKLLLRKMKAAETKSLEAWERGLAAFVKFNDQLAGLGFNFFVRVKTVTTPWAEYIEKTEKKKAQKVTRPTYRSLYSNDTYRDPDTSKEEAAKKKTWADYVVNDQAGSTLFHLLMINPIERVLTQLLDFALKRNEYTPNERNLFGETVFLHFARNFAAPSNIAEILVRQGENPNLDDGDGNYPLLQICQNNNLKCLEQFLTLGPNLNVQSSDGTTALLYFTRRRAIAEVNLLLKQGADSGIPDSKGRNALHWAINNNTQKDTNFELEELLIGTGININHTDIRGRQPIHYFFTKIGEPFINAKRDPIEILADFLVVPGLEIDRPDLFGNSPLSYAAQRGSNLSFGALVKRGADINRLNNHGNCPLSLAMINNHVDVAVFCLQKGVNFNRPVFTINFAGEQKWREYQDQLVLAKERMAGKGLRAIGWVQPGVIRKSKVSEYIDTRKKDEDLIFQMEGRTQETAVGSPQSTSPRTRVQAITQAPTQAKVKRAKKNAFGQPENQSESDLSIEQLKEMAKTNFLIRKISLFKLAIENGADAVNYLLIDGGLSLGSATMDSIEAGLFKYAVKLLSKRVDQSNPRFLDQFSFQNDHKENIAHAFGKKAATMDEATGKAIVELFGMKKVPINLADERGITPLMYTAYHSKNLELIQHLIDRGADSRAKDKSGNWLVSCYLQNNPLLKKDRDLEDKKPQPIRPKAIRSKRIVLANPLKLMNATTPGAAVFSNFQGFGFTHSQSLSQGSISSTPAWGPNATGFNSFGSDDSSSNNFATPAGPIRRAMTGAIFPSSAQTHSFHEDDSSTPTSLSVQETVAIDWIVKQLLISQGHVNSRFEKFEPDHQTLPRRPQYVYTLLSFALKRLRNFHLARALLQHGADINAQDEHGHTILTWAIKQNQVEVFEFLMTFADKIDFNYQDKESKTYIHHIVSPLEFASYENVQFLNTLGPKTNLNKLDRTGRPPILYAEAQHSQRMLRALKGLGAQSYNGPLAVKYAVPAIAGEEYLENPYDFEEDHRKAIERAERMFRDSDQEVVEKPKPSPLIVGKTTLCSDDAGRPYEVKLIKVEVKYGFYSENVFYVMQIVRDEVRRIYVLFTNWGRVGTEGQHQQTPFFSLGEAIKEFRKIFKEKTGNEYGDPAHFIKKANKYRQILTTPRPKNHHLVALFDPETSMTVPSRLQPDLMELVAHITDRKLLQVVYNQVNLDPEAMPFGNLTQEVIQEAKHVLSEILALARNLANNRETLPSREMFEIAMEISEKTSRYLELVPTVGNKVEQIPPFNINRVNQEIIRINDLENLELVSRILGAATYRLKDMHPYEYTLRSLGIKIVRLPEENEEHALVRKYVEATRAKTSFTLSNVYAVERKGEAEAFALGVASANVRLLWHGTRTENVLGILNQGLRITPSEAQKTGTRLGAGLYFSDTFSRAISFSSDFSNWDRTQKVYAILCEVALGKMQRVYDLELFKPPGTEFNSTKGKGQITPDKSQRVFTSSGTMIPIGRPITKQELAPTESKSWSFDESEYVVYTKSQAKIKYLVELSYSREGENGSVSSAWD